MMASTTFTILEDNDSSSEAVSRSFVPQWRITVFVPAKWVCLIISLAVGSVGHLIYVHVVSGHNSLVSIIRPFESQSITVSLLHIFV